MFVKKTLSAILLGALSAACFAANPVSVLIEGPGGHSNGDYGTVNAVHAAARAIMEIQKTVPDAVASGLNGGNSVNSIASSATFEVYLPKDDPKLVELVKKATLKGVADENAFRGVKAGQTTSEGLRIDVRASFK